MQVSCSGLLIIIGLMLEQRAVKEKEMRQEKITWAQLLSLPGYKGSKSEEIVVVLFNLVIYQTFNRNTFLLLKLIKLIC